MFKFVIGLLMAVAAVAEKDWGRGMIVGGTTAPNGRYPYVAGLYFSTTTTTPSCGGTLIAPNVVMSAAHCAGPVRVRVGCYSLSSTCGETFSISRQVVHPNYNTNTLSNDFMILELSGSSSIDPIAWVADSSSAFSTGYVLTVMGWGATSQGGSGATTLREVDVPAFSNSDCGSQTGYSSSEITGSMICAGYAEGGRDSCQGDSGGPLIARCDNGNDLLAGVVSWGYGCAQPSYPGVYARMSAVRAWVEARVNEAGSSLASPPSIANLCGGAGSPPAPVPAPVPAPAPTPTGGCSDTVPSGLIFSSDGSPAECAVIAPLGYCTVAIVQERCPASCGLCVREDGTIADSTHFRKPLGGVSVIDAAGYKEYSPALIIGSVVGGTALIAVVAGVVIRNLKN